MSLDVRLYVHVETGGSEPYEVTLFDANITHNLGHMAFEAGIYDACWRPGEMLAPDIAARIREQQEASNWHGAGGVFELETLLPTPRASDLIEPLTAGLAAMKADPARFEKLNASNGWGLYEHFVPWVERYLEACKTHPAAFVKVNR